MLEVNLFIDPKGLKSNFIPSIVYMKSEDKKEIKKGFYAFEKYMQAYDTSYPNDFVLDGNNGEYICSFFDVYIFDRTQSNVVLNISNECSLNGFILWVRPIEEIRYKKFDLAKRYYDEVRRQNAKISAL